jgi:hypothetical protein
MAMERRDQSLLNDPEHWRKQADEMRRLAATSRDDVRAGLLRVALEYDALADRAEQRLQQARAFKVLGDCPAATGKSGAA